MDWRIDFITEQDFRGHVARTIAEYGDKLKPYVYAKNLKEI